MKNTIAILSLFAAMSASAAIVDVSDLSANQQAQIVKQIEDLKQGEEKNISKTARQELTAWGELGSNMGRATVAAAKEVGMAAGEFAETPIGKITTAIIVYKIVGKDVLKLFVGVFLLFVLSPLLLFYFLKNHQFYTNKYEYLPVLFGLWNRRMLVSSVTREATREEDSTHDVKLSIAIVGSGACFIASMFVLFG